VLPVDVAEVAEPIQKSFGDGRNRRRPAREIA
jgi:hypothetical protein